MTRIVLMAVWAAMAAVDVFAQAPSELIDRALTAAPAPLRDGATVIRWKTDFTYETLRTGTNRLVCFDRSGDLDLAHMPFAAECTSTGNLARVAQNFRFEAAGEKKQVLFDAAERDG